MESNRLAIIIPAYNEEETIGSVIKEIFSALDNNAKIIVANDFSKDSTSKMASEAGAIVLDLEYNHGYAKAIERGLDYAIENLNVDYLITMDADGQHNPISIIEMYQKVSVQDYDVIVGQRPTCARFSERLYSLYFKLRYKVIDPLSGLKLYKTSFYREIGSFETYDSIGTELLSKALSTKRSVGQVPIVIRQRQDSKPRFGGVWKANIRILVSLLSTIRRF